VNADHREELQMTAPEEEFTPDEHLEPEERDPEAPADDAVEQATPVNPEDVPVEIHRGLEVDEYDAIEQALPVDRESDEY
jgi:hypothetical protein